MISARASAKLVVIVPVYQDWDKALELIECLKKQTLPVDLWSALFVDNGSDDVPESSSLPSFVTMLSCAKPGSYAARNRALEVAEGDYFVFTDADCRPSPQWLEKLIDRFEKADSPGLVAGDVCVQKLDAGMPNLYELYDMALGLPQERYVSRGYAITANLAVRGELFKLVGRFNPERFSGGDAEFCRRAVAAGYGLVFEQSALVYHPARSDWNQLSRKTRRVKGGQILNGSLKRRAMFFGRTFMPPVFAFALALRCDRLTRMQQFKVCAVQVRLWFVEMAEVARLVMGSSPERR